MESRKLKAVGTKVVLRERVPTVWLMQQSFGRTIKWVGVKYAGNTRFRKDNE